MLLGLVLIGLAAISWGTTGATMATLAAGDAPGPLFVGWARLAIAAPCLIAAAVVAARRRPRARPWTGLAARDLPTYALLGFAMAAYQVCYFRAVMLSGVAVTALLAICTAPILIALLAAALLGERLTAPVKLSLALAVTGTALLVVGPRPLGALSGSFGAGALLALGAGLSYAVYAVAAKRVLSRASPVSVAAITFGLAALFLAPAVVSERISGAQVARAVPLLLYLGIGPTAVAYVLFTIGLARVPATAAGIASLLEPLTATALGVVVFGESLGGAGAIGGVLLIAALVLLASRRETASAPS